MCRKFHDSQVITFAFPAPVEKSCSVSGKLTSSWYQVRVEHFPVFRRKKKWRLFIPPWKCQRCSSASNSPRIRKTFSSAFRKTRRISWQVIFIIALPSSSFLSAENSEIFIWWAEKLFKFKDTKHCWRNRWQDWYAWISREKMLSRWKLLGRERDRKFSLFGGCS